MGLASPAATWSRASRQTWGRRARGGQEAGPPVGRGGHEGCRHGPFRSLRGPRGLRRKVGQGRAWEGLGSSSGTLNTAVGEALVEMALR